MPLIVARDAIYPVPQVPRWLQAVSHANPLTHEVDALRAAMLAQGASAYGLSVDLGVLLAVTGPLMALAARLYPLLGD
jgi:ABC-2 type transport system permease protein